MWIDIPDELRDEDVAVGLVKAYFADDPATGRARYSGAYFERLGGGGDQPEVAYQLTADDLLAEADRLIVAGGPAWELWQLLHDIKPRPQDRNRLGKVAAGKLLARIRPHLIPVYDSHVKKVLRRPSNDRSWWSDLRRQLIKDGDLVRELERVRTRAGASHLSLLRTFDIMCWMFGGSVGA